MKLWKANAGSAGKATESPGCAVRIVRSTLLIVSVLAYSLPLAASERPNILLIVLDDAGLKSFSLPATTR